MKRTNCWLSNFNLEYIGADFKSGTERIHKEVIQERKIISTGEVKTFDVGGKKDCQDRNNARNVDAFSVTKCNHILEGEKEMVNGSNRLRSTNQNEVEDVLITMIDLMKRQNRRKLL